MAGKNGCDSVPRAADKISDGLKSLIFQVTLSKRSEERRVGKEC